MTYQTGSPATGPHTTGPSGEVSQARTVCPRCRKPVDSRWAFCEWCSHDLGPARQAAAAATPTRRDRFPFPRLRRPSWRVVAVAAAVVLTAGVVGRGAVVLHDTRGELKGTQRTLTATQHDLDDTTTLLNRTDSALEGANEKLRAEQELRQNTQADLEGVKGSLADADSKVNAQAGQIDTLKTCLTGVSTALRAAARDDYDAAIAALDSVQPACDKAYALF